VIRAYVRATDTAETRYAIAIRIVGTVTSLARGKPLTTTIVIAYAVVALRTKWTAICRIGDAVTVVVGIRAAVEVVEAIAVFRLAWTAIEVIGDAIAVRVVRFGTTIVVILAIVIFGCVRAGVAGVRIPSPSLSGSGQPSPSWNSSMSSIAVG
jgi:hypothetical protein